MDSPLPNTSEWYLERVRYGDLRHAIHTKEEVLNFYNNMPNLRTGDLFTFVKFMKQKENNNKVLKCFHF
jgi:hypothetical protein